MCGPNISNAFAEFRGPVFLKMEPSILRQNDKQINQMSLSKFNQNGIVFAWEKFGVKNLTLLSKEQGKCRFNIHSRDLVTHVGDKEVCFVFGRFLNNPVD